MELIWISIGIILAIWLERKIYNPHRIHSVYYQLEMEKSRVKEGDSVSMIETITNKGFLPFSLVATEVEVAKELGLYDKDYDVTGRRQTVSRKSSLIWFQKVIREYRLTADRRGVHQARLASFRYGDALLLDTHWIKMEGSTTLIVYPRIYAIERLLSLPLSLFGDHFVRRWILEDYFFPSGVRDYQPGDNIRFVDWKKSAKHQSLQTRTYDYTNSNELYIVMNLQTANTLWGGTDVDKVENIIRVAASLVHAAADEGFETGLFANGGCIGYKGQTLVLPPHLYQGVDQLYECLARLTSFHSQRFSFFLENQSNWFTEEANILLITSYMDEETAEGIYAIKTKAKSLKILTVGELDNKYKDMLGIPIYPVQLEEELKHA